MGYENQNFDASSSLPAGVTASTGTWTIQTFGGRSTANCLKYTEVSHLQIESVQFGQGGADAGDRCGIWFKTTGGSLGGYYDALVYIRCTANTIYASNSGYCAWASMGTLEDGKFHLAKAQLTDLATPITPSGGFQDGVWYHAVVEAAVSAIKAYLQRDSDSKWLKPDGAWQSTQIAAFSVTDTSFTAQGYAGAAAVSNSGTMLFDDLTFEASAAPPTPGTVSVSVTGDQTATVSTTAASGGTAPYTYQFQRAPDSSGSPGAYANVGSASSSTSYADSGMTSHTAYWWRCVVTDAVQSANSSGVSAIVGAAATFYVATAGSDSNNGTATATPWQTISKVNSSRFVPGDSILFNGGDSFSGNLALADSGTSGSAITLDSYGTGQATINFTTGHGVALTDNSYVTVQNLVITGPGVTPASGVTTSTGSGVQVHATSTGTNWTNITLSNLTISGALRGINVDTAIASGSSGRGFDNVTISGCTIHDCATWGIRTRSTTSNVPGRTFTNVTVSNCHIYNIYGQTANATETNGDGIVLGNVTTGTITGCRVHDNGANYTLAGGGGPGGIWVFSCTAITIEKNESYLNHDPVAGDGMGIDLDSDTQNCIVRWNLTHQNDGAGIETAHAGGAFPANSGNQFYGNVSVADGQFGTNTSSLTIAPSCFSAVGDTNAGAVLVFGNTFIVKPSAHNPNLSLLNNRGGPIYFTNNIVFWDDTTNGTLAETIDYLHLYGNLYFRRGGGTALVVAGTSYASLAAFAAATLGGFFSPAGQETVASVVVGIQADPKFAGSAVSATMNPASANSYSGVDLQSASPAIDAGLDILTQLGVAGPTADFHGLGLKPRGTYPMGAVGWSGAVRPEFGFGPGALGIGV